MGRLRVKPNGFIHQDGQAHCSGYDAGVFGHDNLWCCCCLRMGQGFGIVIIVFAVIAVLNAYGDWQILRRGGVKGN